MFPQQNSIGTQLMNAVLKFDPKGPSNAEIKGSVPLRSVKLPVPGSSGLYLVTCGHCLAHVGTSGNLRNRVRTLATLGTHRGSSEVLCATFCTGEPPRVWWIQCSMEEATRLEREFKSFYGEPPSPASEYRDSCKNGRRLRKELVEAAGIGTWQAGYIDAMFDIGEKLGLLFTRREFEEVWNRVGRPPGPWQTLRVKERVENRV